MSSQITLEKAFKKLIDARQAYAKAQSDFDQVYGAFRAQGTSVGVVAQENPPIRNDSKKAAKAKQASDAQPPKKPKTKKKPDVGRTWEDLAKDSPNDKDGTPHGFPVLATREAMEAEIRKLHKAGWNDVRISEALNFKRSLIERFRKKNNLKPAPQGRPKANSVNSVRLEDIKDLPDLLPSAKTSSGKAKAPKKKSAGKAAAESVEVSTPAAESPTPPSLEFRISPAEVEKASIEFPITAEEVSNHLGPEQTFPPELNLPGLVGRKILKFFDGPRFQYLKANGVLEKIEGSYYCITKRP